MAEQPISHQEIANREHIAPSKTGDNIAAKKVANYSWDGNNWGRSIFGLLTLPYDELVINYTDATKDTIASIVSKLAGTTQQTLTNNSTSTSDDFVRS